MYVLLIITLNRWHLCFSRGILHRKSTGYALLPNFILSGLYTEHIFNIGVSVLIFYFCQEVFFSRGRCVSDMCVAVFVSYGGRRHKSVHALCRGVFGLQRGVRSSVCRHFVEGVPAAFPFTFLSPLFHPLPMCGGVWSLHYTYCMLSVSLSQYA